MRREEVYRDGPGPSPAALLEEPAEGLSTSYGAGASAQAERRARPRRRRAWMIARPARVAMRWRKPCRLDRFLWFGW